MRLFNYQAADARPYALGTCVASAALWFLVKWCDESRWRDAALFLIFAALLWRVHLIYWPCYILFFLYAAVRVPLPRVLTVFTILAAALIPVALRALAILHQAQAHVVADHMPGPSDLNRALKFSLVLGCPAAAWLLSRLVKSPYRAFNQPTLILVLGWWLIHPLALFAFSWFTHNSVFVDRYLSVSLPGAALTATLLTAYFLPPQYWRNGSLAFGVGVVLLMGSWRVHLLHHNSNWRLASETVRALHLPASTPIIYPSVFIEARPPVWRPDYDLPGFLYCHLLIYPISGSAYLFPFEMSPDAEGYGAELARGVLPGSASFVIYGGDVNAERWQKWFAARPELARWHSRSLGKFGDVEPVLFERDAN